MSQVDSIYLEAVENGFDSIWILKLPSFELAFCNQRQTEGLLGHPVERYFADALFWFSLVLEGDRALALQANDTCLLKGEAEAEYRMRRADGAVVWVHARLRLVRNGADEPTRLIGTSMDITRRKEAEQALLHSSKMASLGEMAAGIAHEINNPLAIICGKAELLLRLLRSGRIDEAAFAEDLGRISATGERIARIIRGLRTFSSSEESDPPVPADAARIVEGTLAFCRERFESHGVELKLAIEPGLALECRPAQVSQVLLNLLFNAFDAVQGRASRWIELKVQGSGEQIRFRISDSGGPIPDHVRERLMQPFFTTKRPGKGMGLGLSVSKGLVESHGGRLYLDASQPSTCFVVELPRTGLPRELQA